MDIIRFSVDKWYLFSIKINWIIIAIIMLGVYGVVKLWKGILKYSIKQSVSIDRVVLGIGTNSVTLKYNKKDQEIAYKLWVELNTRKIGLKYDEQFDVIDEVYNSWYAFFGIARELLKDIPVEKLDSSDNLVELTGDVLNKGLRPHLTKWQAKYRKWYENNKESEEYKTLTPQEIQRKYPLYEELVKELKETNCRMIEYKKVMKKIAYGYKE